MNIRNVTVPKGVPMCSTGMLYSKVSLPCEPWETPAPKKSTPVQAAPSNDAELLILATIKPGTNIRGHRHQGFRPRLWIDQRSARMQFIATIEIEIADSNSLEDDICVRVFSEINEFGHFLPERNFANMYLAGVQEVEKFK